MQAMLGYYEERGRSQNGTCMINFNWSSGNKIDNLVVVLVHALLMLKEDGLT